MLCSGQFNTWQLRTLDAIRRCRTASLGGHVDLCTSCGHVRISYNSCRNRHCPKCQQVQRERWIQAREAELLPATYFHVVFTLPEALNKLCLYQPAVIYNILFDTAWSVVQDFAHDQKTSWGRYRNDHHTPHLGTESFASSSPSLHCSGWWSDIIRKVEACAQ